MASVDLSGTWRAAPADEVARRAYTDAGFDDGSWALADVPGHWRSNPAFADSDGPVLHRTSFPTPEPFGPGADRGIGEAGDLGERRTWLVLDGIFATSDVWLDGTYLGDTEGYFFPHSFEVTDALAGAREHVLGIEVACPRPTDLRAKRSLTGLFQHSDVLDRDANPGGIWRPVRLEQSGPVRVRHARARCSDVRDENAILTLRVVLDTAEARPIELVTTFVPRGPAGESVTVRRSQPLAAGENRVEWTVAVPDPQRWWPHSLGDQPMYDVHVEVRTEDGACSDERRWAIGLRTVQARDWIWSVNGERLYLKGADLTPTRLALGEAAPAEIAADVELARTAGLDLLRVHAHVSRPELYDAADAAGVLLWQDLPLQWGYSRTVRRQARRQAREAVDLLAHHPSVIVWCGHNEPMAIDPSPDALDDRRRRRRLVGHEVRAQVLPSWNRTLLDRAVKSVLEHEDGTRPVIAHSGVLPHLPQLDGTDSHLYFGWYHGDERDLPGFLARWPRLGRFVSEFGVQAVPPTDGFIDTSAWPDLDWEGLGRHHALQKAMFDRYVPPERFARYADWKEATGTYQARVVRYHIETLRRLKYQPNGGFAVFCLADSAPAVSWSLLDHERRPKPAWAALVEACRPVIIVAERPPEHVHPGDRLVLDLHAVNDRHIALSDMIVRAHLSHGTETKRAWSWQGDLPADSCVRVGAVEIEVPDIDDALVLDLRLTGELPVGVQPGGTRADADRAIDVASRYGTWVVRGDHEH